MSAARLEILAGGTPAPAQLAAVAAAVTAMLEGEVGPDADPVPAVYRSGWRRAAVLEAIGHAGAR